jgi:hypothetical protein
VQLSLQHIFWTVPGPSVELPEPVSTLAVPSGCWANERVSVFETGMVEATWKRCAAAVAMMESFIFEIGVDWSVVSLP